MKSIALIPAYKPEKDFIMLAKNVSEKLELVVVNDGSGKEYANIFTEISKYAHVISYEENHGKGYALKKGLAYIHETYKEDYKVVTMDSDGQHRLEDAINLLEYVEKYPNNLVLGKRLRNEKTPLKSRMGNVISKFIFFITTGVNIYDTQTGLRAFTNKLMDLMLNISGDRYEYEMNVLFECAKERIRINEIQIETIYFNNNKNSHFKVIRDSFLIYKEIIKFAMSSMFSAIIDYVLYTLIYIFSSNIYLANILARVISATCNYSINKVFVFKHKNKVLKTFIQYFGLAGFILIVNTSILYVFVKVLHFNPFISKIFVEVILFFFSLFVQKCLIFRRKGR